MTSDRFHQAVSGMGHVAVIAEAAAGISGVMAMRLNVFGKFFVALLAGLVAFHARGQLIIWIALMHRMTRETGKLTALETWGFDQAVVIAAGDANHSIAPEEIVEQ